MGLGVEYRTYLSSSKIAEESLLFSSKTPTREKTYNWGKARVKKMLKSGGGSRIRTYFPPLLMRRYGYEGTDYAVS